MRNPPPNPGLARGLWISAGLMALFALLTLLVAGPLHRLDVALNFRRDIDDIRPALMVLDRIGQRAVCLPILAVVAFVAGRRAGTRRPLVVAAVSVIALNLVVAALKFGLERGAPLQGEPGFLEGGVMYPSGHTANVVLVYGLGAYLWCRYTSAPRRTGAILGSIVLALTVTMVVVSLTLRWHWFTDLIAGMLVGAAVLSAATAVDRKIPLDWRRERIVPHPLRRDRRTDDSRAPQLSDL